MNSTQHCVLQHHSCSLSLKQYFVRHIQFIKYFVGGMYNSRPEETFIVPDINYVVQERLQSPATHLREWTHTWPVHLWFYD
jgi:hypothetical protein